MGRSSSVGCGGVVFDFQMGRGREGPKSFLGNFRGLLQTDGYKAYDKVGGPGIVHAACLAHARRKHVGAVKANTKDTDSARIVALMDELFAIDREAREKNMSLAERDRPRHERARATRPVACAIARSEEIRAPQKRRGQGCRLHLIAVDETDALPRLPRTGALHQSGRKLHAPSRHRAPQLAAPRQQRGRS